MCSRVLAAAIAVPGPVIDNGAVAVVSNFHAKDTEGRTVRVKDLPPQLCPAGRTKLINDLFACSAGIAGLNHIGAFSDTFTKMWGPGSETTAALGQGSVVVLAPGTGLGTALLHYDAETGRFIPVPLEFGHTHISTFKHHILMSSFVQKLGRGNHPVEFDDVCTGRGLEHIHSVTLSSGDTGAGVPSSVKMTAPKISALAKDGDIMAMSSFSIMYAILMNLASQLAMGFVPHSVIIAGDNAVRHDFFLSNPQQLEILKKAFHAHTMERMGFMSRVQVARQSKEMNLNLIGAAFTAGQLVGEGGAGGGASAVGPVSKL